MERHVQEHFTATMTIEEQTKKNFSWCFWTLYVYYNTSRFGSFLEFMVMAESNKWLTVGWWLVIHFNQFQIKESSILVIYHTILRFSSYKIFTVPIRNLKARQLFNLFHFSNLIFQRNRSRFLFNILILRYHSFISIKWHFL